jgi:hypothetical protein
MHSSDDETLRRGRAGQLLRLSKACTIGGRLASLWGVASRA